MHGNLFFGWKVVAAAFVAAVFAWGIGLYGPPVFVHALHAGRGWPVSTIAAAVTIHFLISAGFVIWLSDIHRRIGLAWTTRLGALGLGVGAVAWALADAPAHLFGAALITGAGWGMSSGAAVAAMVTPWFKRRLPLAFSIAYNGASLGGLTARSAPRSSSSCGRSPAAISGRRRPRSGSRPTATRQARARHRPRHRRSRAQCCCATAAS